MNLKYFYSKFNQEVNLPENLTHLTFCGYFNQQVNLHPRGCSKNSTAGCCSCCPSNLTYLTFGEMFNQQVKLPLNLTHLTFGSKFNQLVNLHPKGCLKNITAECCSCRPSNLTHLTFGYYFNQQVNLPLNIKYLNINCNNVNITDYLPDSVEELFLNYNFNLELNNLQTKNCL